MRAQYPLPHGPVGPVGPVGNLVPFGNLLGPRGFSQRFRLSSSLGKAQSGGSTPKMDKIPWCPIGANLETVEHALFHCRFHAMAWDTIDCRWGPRYVEGVSYAVRALTLKHSFSRPKGIAKWSAQAAHWLLRNQAKNGFSAPSLEHFLGEPQAQCVRSATIWASGRTRDPYFEILGAPRGIMVTPSGGFARCSTFGARHGKA